MAQCAHATGTFDPLTRMESAIVFTLAPQGVGALGF
jgi:hypothetical protein